LNNSGNGSYNLTNNYGKNQNYSSFGLSSNNKQSLGDFINGKGLENTMKMLSNL
jgi:hypothetical protein